MVEQNESTLENRGLRSKRWLLSYKTSSTRIDGRPVDLLKDFYLPALSLASRYDRVAGYFRSSSLAAASQGFSAFVGQQGKMRLIVGADLEPADVKAILHGDSQRLEARLNERINQPASWPEDVKNGITLLAWMVAHEYLEVRVAFRVHGVTGEPLAPDSVDDGYVHEKWFIMHDEFGNRLYGSGTLNESKTALVLNAENIDVHCDWWGETDCLRVDEAAESFENLWAGRVPHMPVLTLPDAVKRRLVRLADGIERPVEVDGSSAAPALVEPPSALERLRFAVLRDAPKMPGGRLVGMETAPVVPWPHQTVVVRRLVETWPYSYLLCDEVGLGKTIEAGLAFRSLYLSGLVKRILIAAPASLTIQWQRQMASKLLMSFGRVRTMPELSHKYIFPVNESQTSSSLYEPDLVIMSTGLLARSERAAALLEAQTYDIVLVDEAHAARRRNPGGGLGVHPDFVHLYTAIRDFVRKKARGLWLATATPMQLNAVEVCDLLALTNRVGAFQYDPTLTLQYYEVIDKLIHGQEQGKEEWEFLRRAVSSIQVQDPMLWRFLEESVIDGRIRTAVRHWLEYGRVPRGRDRDLIPRLVFSASPLSRVMLRHTRRLLEIYRDSGQLQQNLARRHIQPIPRITFNPKEKHIYDKLENYCRGLVRQIRAGQDSQIKQMVSFLLSFLRLRFASSFYAFRKTLQRRLNKVEATLRYQLILDSEESELGLPALQELVFEGEEEDDILAIESLLKNRNQADLEWEREQLKEMLAEMADISGLSSKMQVLLNTLDRRRNRQTRHIRQTVIFTRFYDTLTDIVNRLRQVDPGMLIGTYSGQGAECFDPAARQMARVDREEVKERFLRGEIDVLVCTDAAAEGLNLQSADLLINYDLGWNPMKIEQRIGRIDRIGQKHADICVLNLCYAGSAEETVYGRLLSRLAEANMIVGTQQFSLLPVEPEDFRRLAEGELTSDQLMAKAEKSFREQRERTESMEINPRELYEIYMRLARERSRKHAPVDLTAIWEALSKSRYLRDLGCAASADKDKKTVMLSGIKNIPDGTLLTISRELYDEGIADSGTRLHFASFGDPYFEAVLKHMDSFELPGCVQRIAVGVPGMEGVEMVGYAAACHGVNGVREIRLICSWTELQRLKLAEQETLAETEIEPLRTTLEQLAREEFASSLTANRIERENIRAAHTQEILDFLVIKDLLQVKRKAAGEEANFWTLLREISSLVEEREKILVNELPADLLRPVARDLLFDCQIPNIGDNAHILAPRILGRAAVDAASRVADSMKVRRSELETGTVLTRLQRELENRKRKVSWR